VRALDSLELSRLEVQRAHRNPWRELDVPWPADEYRVACDGQRPARELL